MAKKQGRNARLDESLGVRRGKESTKKQSYKSRRDESRGATKKKSSGARKKKSKNISGPGLGGGSVMEVNDLIVAKYYGGGVTSTRGRGGANVRPRVNVLGEGAAAAHQRAQRGGTHASELARLRGTGSQRTQSAGGARGARGGRPGMQGGGSVTSVRGRGGPNVSPRVNVLGEAAARAHQRAQRGGLAGQQRPTFQPSMPPRQPAVQARRGRRGPGGGV